MEKRNQRFALTILVILFLTSIISCSSIPCLEINYQLPRRSDILRKVQVVYEFDDARRIREVLGKGAKEDFENFSGNIFFSVARYNEPGFRIGLYKPSAIVKEGFKRRLENIGLQLVQDQYNEKPRLLIVLNEFVLDLVDRKWVAKMSYEARLLQNGKILATQTISGKNVRLKIMGRGGADAILGETFTDMVNKLDIEKLFRQAKLLYT